MSTQEDKKYFAYIVECKDGSLYTGFTTDLANRVRTHNEGKGAKYTKARRPVRLGYYEEFATKQLAMKREAAIKKLTHQQKQELINKR